MVRQAKPVAPRSSSRRKRAGVSPGCVPPRPFPTGPLRVCPSGGWGGGVRRPGSVVPRFRSSSPGCWPEAPGRFVLTRGSIGFAGLNYSESERARANGGGDAALTAAPPTPGGGGDRHQRAPPPPQPRFALTAPHP
ncbi:unnamed protein product [Lampetra fluviatilis]